VRLELSSNATEASMPAFSVTNAGIFWPITGSGVPTTQQPG
jgi:hypothetical protein